VVVHTEITERKQAEEVDKFLSQAGIESKEPFFDALARFLANCLQMDYVCIDRLVGDELNATTLAIWHDGAFEDNVTYALKDTPCGDVVEQRVCCFPDSVCRLFPNDAALRDLQAESYIGVTLMGHTGQPIGLIAVIGRQKLASRAFAQAALERIAPRAASEIERLTVEAALREREAHFRTLVEVIPDAIVVHRSGKLVFVNPAAVRLLGATSEQDLIDKPILDLIHPDFHQVVLNRVKNAVEQGENSPPLEERYVRLDGSMFDAEVQGRPIVLEGKPAVMVTLKDITEKKLAQEQLQLAASVFSHAREGIMITEPDGTIIDVNEAFTRITGYARHEALGRNPRFMSSGRHDAQYYADLWRNLLAQGYWYGEIWNRRKNGELFAEMQAVSAVRDDSGAVRHYVSLFSDITALKEQQNRLEHIAHFDPLTSLPNRVLLADRLKQGMAQAQRRSQQLAVVYLDLDGFKSINDHHGHDVGDQVLIALASRMNQTLREGDTLARLGGDEFVAVLIDLEDASASLPMLRRLLDSAALPVRVGEQTLQVTASLGVAFFPQDQEVDADQMLRQADQTMYQAKLAGKNRYHIFDAAHDSSLRVHHEGVERIRQGLANQEFVLHYQPKVNMRSGKVIGAEALIRWQHPRDGLLVPADFLPMIEEHPLAVTLGEWVIDTALAQVAQWHLAGFDLPVSVNVGARQIQQSDFVDRLCAILARHPTVKPSKLELEILETSALEDIARVSQVIEDCAQMGVMFALDDFGTGYSSLTYLKRLRVNALKIDQSFVCDMLQDPDDLAILQGVIGLAEAFKREVIAEGVETVAHGTLLLQLGCELAQGHGIAHPMPAHALPNWVVQWQPDLAWRQAAPQPSA
jgi:diguanylate cyclase (GGDEF)-like protein/PAS domain S-box-containing protein